jgi:hypothetical protein
MMSLAMVALSAALSAKIISIKATGNTYCEEEEHRRAIRSSVTHKASLA